MGGDNDLSKDTKTDKSRAPVIRRREQSEEIIDPALQLLQDAGNQALQTFFDRDQFGLQSGEPFPGNSVIPEHPLAEYYNLFLALTPSDMRDLENAARRRESLRRGLPYSGPAGFFIAQAPLASFQPPEATFVSREAMLSRNMPLLLAAARQELNPSAITLEIARNEAARNYLERLPKPDLVSVELVDHDGLMKDVPPTLRFTVGVTPVEDLHGEIPLTSLDRMSPRTLKLESMISTHNAEQLRDIALLQVQTENGLRDTLPVAIQMETMPGKFALNDVREVNKVVRALRARLRTASEVLTAENSDQRSLLASLDQQSATLEAHCNAALTVGLRFAREHEPEETAGELYSEYEEEREHDIREDWKSGGWGYLKMLYHGVDWGATEFFHGAGVSLTAGYMGLEAKNAAAYRRGDISYESYSSNVYWNMGKSLVVAAVTAVTAGFGGEAAVAFVGLEPAAGVAYATTYGMASGVTGGFTGALSSDAFSLFAASTSGDPGVQAMQRSDVLGPQGWVNSASLGGMAGGVFSFGLSRLSAPPPPSFSVPLTPKTPVAGFESFEADILPASAVDLQFENTAPGTPPPSAVPEIGIPRISPLWQSATTRFGEAEYLASGAPASPPVLYAEIGGRVSPLNAPPPELTVLSDGQIVAGKPSSGSPILFGAGGERIYATGDTLPGVQILAPSGEPFLSAPTRIYLDPEFVPREAGRPGLFEAGGNWRIRSSVSGQQMRACYALEEQMRASFARRFGGGGANRTLLPTAETFAGRAEPQNSIVTDFTNTARDVYADAKVRDFLHPRFGQANTLDLLGTVQRMIRAAHVDAQLLGSATSPDFYVVSARPIPLATTRFIIRELVDWLRLQNYSANAIYDLLSRLKFVQMRLK